MKKTNLLSLIGVFSLAAASVMAGPAKHLKNKRLKPITAIAAKKYVYTKEGHNYKKPMTGSSLAGLQYPNTDYALQPNYTLSTGWVPEPINNRYSAADTITSNYDEAVNAIVAFDTIMDYYSNGLAFSAVPGSVTIDTLTAPVAYLNTSGTNDTIFFKITNVTASGFPGTTVWHTDTIVLNKGLFLPGNTLDSLYYIQVLPNYTVPTGTKFAVQLIFAGSKSDSLEFCFGYPNASCSSSGYDYANTFTLIGPQFGPTPACNSFVDGWADYEWPTFQHQIWPNDSGNQSGSFDGANPFDNDEWDLCGTDTEYFYWQDIAIFATISYNQVTGVNTITNNNGLNISQNMPNPCGASTQINYSLNKASDIVFTVNDITGRTILTNNYNGMAPGQHAINLNTSTLSPGVYFYTFNINGVKQSRKMIITE